MSFWSKLRNLFQKPATPAAEKKESELEPGEVYVKDTPAGKRYRVIAQGTCPNCFAFERFQIGPSGGMSTNIQCAECGQRYNVTPIIGIAEEI